MSTLRWQNCKDYLREKSKAAILKMPQQQLQTNTEQKITPKRYMKSQQETENKKKNQIKKIELENNQNKKPSR